MKVFLENRTTSVLEERPLTVAKSAIILLWSLVACVEVAIVLTSSTCAAPPRYKLQIEMLTLFSLSSMRSLSMTIRKKVEERTEPYCIPRNTGKGCGNGETTTPQRLLYMQEIILQALPLMPASKS